MYERWSESGPKETCRFITLRTVDSIDVFVRPVYKQVIVHSLNHFIASKGLVVYAWCLMTHHLHLLACTRGAASLEELETAYKTFTSAKILEAIETEPAVRKEWMLEHFREPSHLFGFSKKYQVWENDPEPAAPVMIRKPHLLLEHIEHIHQNPVRDKIVETPSEYLYSSARDYTGVKGLVQIIKIPVIEQQLAAMESINGNFFVRYIRN